MKKNRFRSTAVLGSTALYRHPAACVALPGNDANEVTTSVRAQMATPPSRGTTEREPLLSFWDDIAQEFSDEHGVNVEAQAYQNEDLQHPYSNQLRTGEGLDLFQQWVLAAHSGRRRVRQGRFRRTQRRRRRARREHLTLAV